MKEICTLLVKLHIIFSRMQRVITSMLAPLLYRWGVPPVVIRCVHWTMQMWVLQAWIIAQGLAIVVMHSVCPPLNLPLVNRNKTFPNYITQYHLPPHTHTQKIMTKIYHFTMVSKLSTHNCSQFTAQYLKTIHWLGHEVGHPLYLPQSRSHNPKTRWLLKQLSGGPLLGARATCWVNHRGLNGFAEASQGIVSLTFRNLSKIFSRNVCVLEIALSISISSWNFVRVPKAMLWAHLQIFSLKFSP